jgi:propionate CoA-transferase
VFYVSERAVFELQQEGLCLLEVAHRFRLKEDVLDLIPFPVKVSTEYRQMPADIFEERIQPFHLRAARSPVRQRS